MLKSGLNDLEKKMKNGGRWKRNWKPNIIEGIIENILEFHKQKQEEQELKVLISNQMLSRWPITLAQLKERNNSEKLKNEIRQLLCSFYRSKKLTKIYNNLINTI